MISTLTAENSFLETSAPVFNSPKSKPAFHWLWIVALAFVLRIFFLLTVPPPPVALPPVDDDGLYLASGLQIREYFIKLPDILDAVLSGKLFRGEGMLSGLGLEIPWGAMRRGPIYSFFLALVFLGTGGINLPVVYTLQAFLMAVSSGLCYWLGKKMAGLQAGLIAAGLMAVYPPLVFINSLVYQESLAVFLTLLFFVCLFRVLSGETSKRNLISTGGLLFLTAFSRSSLVYFPFFLAALLLVCGVFAGGKQKIRLIPPFVLCFFSFLIPCLLWTAIVSSQFHKPATMAVMDTPGKFVFFSTISDFDGWIPEQGLFIPFPEEMRHVLQKYGVQISEKGWPPEEDLLHAAYREMFRHPVQAMDVLARKFGRLWWSPFDFLWRNLRDGGSVKLAHRILVVTAALGFFMMLSASPQKALLLASVPLYSSLIFLLPSIETRYNLLSMPFLILFSSYAGISLAQNREALFNSVRQNERIISGILILGISAGILSKPEYRLFFLKNLSGEGLFSASFGLMFGAISLFFIAVGFCLSRIYSPAQLTKIFLPWAAVILIPASASAFGYRHGIEWKAGLTGPAFRVRQDIFLPLNTLPNTAGIEIKLDGILDGNLKNWIVLVNGREWGNLEVLRKEEVAPLLQRKLGLPYAAVLNQMKRKPYEMRQWFSLPVSADWLKENQWNQIEIFFRPENQSSLKDFRGWHLAGDFSPRQADSFDGPLLQNTLAQISFYKFVHDDDCRLPGKTPLKNQGSKSSFFDGFTWNTNDLSPLGGVQQGAYRIRISVLEPNGTYSIY